MGSYSPTHARTPLSPRSAIAGLLDRVRRDHVPTAQAQSSANLWRSSILVAPPSTCTAPTTPTNLVQRSSACASPPWPEAFDGVAAFPCTGSSSRAQTARTRFASRPWILLTRPRPLLRVQSTYATSSRSTCRSAPMALALHARRAHTHPQRTMRLRTRAHGALTPATMSRLFLTGPPQMVPTADEPAPPPPTSPWVILGSIPRVAEDEAVPDICRAPAGVAPDSALPRPRRRHRRRAPLRTTTRRSPSSKPRRGRYYAVADLLPLIGSDTAHLRCFFSDLGEWVDRQARLRIPARQGVAVDGWSLA